MDNDSLKKLLEGKQQQHALVVSQLQALDNQRVQLTTAGLELQGQIKLLEELLTQEE